MKLAGKISEERGKELVGKVLPVMIDGYIPDEEVYIGRTAQDAPDIDGSIFVFSDDKLMSGEIVNVLVTKSKKYDLIGEKTGNESTE